MSVSDMRDGGNTHVVCTTPVNFSLAPTKLLHFGAILALSLFVSMTSSSQTVSSFLTSFPDFLNKLESRGQGMTAECHRHR